VKAEDFYFGKVKDTWYMRRMQQVEHFPDKWPDWMVENGRMYHLRLYQLGKVISITTDRWKLVVPLNFRDRVLEENQDLPPAGHLSITKTFLCISQNFYWPGIFRDVVKYVKSCSTCQLHKVEQSLPAGHMSFKRTEKPWTTISTDLLGPYPRSIKGNQYIVVFYDYFTK
jgi:hypothetical protein